VTSWGEIMLDKRQFRALMRSAGNYVKTKTGRLISQTSGSGRLYRGSGGARYRGSYRPGHYRASAAGQPPVMVTGTLKRSLRTYVFKNGEGFAVRERAFYSLFLEAGATGGRPGSRPTGRSAVARWRARRRGQSSRVLEPRPHLDRVMAEEKPNLDRRVEQSLYQGLRWRDTTKK
jgi:hypothetical protein